MVVLGIIDKQRVCIDSLKGIEIALVHYELTLSIKLILGIVFNGARGQL